MCASPVLTLEQLGRDKSAGRVHGPAQAREETKLQDETRRAEASADSFSTEGRKCVKWTPCGVYRSNCMANLGCMICTNISAKCPLLKLPKSRTAMFALGKKLKRAS